MILPFLNRGLKPDPNNYATLPKMQGNIINIDYLNEKRARRVQFEDKKIIGVWLYSHGEKR